MSFDPQNVNLDTADPAQVVCYLFVILIVSSVGTFFPVLAVKVPRFKIPLYVYLFARYFGAGVIVATAFIQ
jgi:zinc transporter 1/2/3